MIIGDNWVWIHTPKTAGSSFEEMMEQRHGIKVYGRQHNTARDIPVEHRDKWIFGFMREPVDAEVSNWRYHNHSWDNNGTFTFERWCRWRYEEERNWGDFLGLNPYPLEYGHLFNIRPQAGYFCDEEGQCLANDIFKFDELQSSLSLISEKIKLDCDLTTFKGMSYGWGRGREDYSQHATQKSIEILTKAKLPDFELWKKSSKLRVSTDYTCPTVPNYAYSR